MESASLIALMKALKDLISGLASGRAAKRRADLKARIVAAMRHAEAQNPAPLVFSMKALAGMLDISPSELSPALDELEREKRVYFVTRTGGYSLRLMPWDRSTG